MPHKIREQESVALVAFADFFTDEHDKPPRYEATHAHEIVGVVRFVPGNPNDFAHYPLIFVSFVGKGDRRTLVAEGPLIAFVGGMSLGGNAISLKMGEGAIVVEQPPGAIGVLPPGSWLAYGGYQS